MSFQGVAKSLKKGKYWATEEKDDDIAGQHWIKSLLLYEVDRKTLESGG